MVAWLRLRDRRDPRRPTRPVTGLDICFIVFGLLLLGIPVLALGNSSSASDQDSERLSSASWPASRITQQSSPQPRLAQQVSSQQSASPWSFRPRPPTNARGVPPVPSLGQPPTGYPQTGPWQQVPPGYPAGTAAPSPSQQPGAFPGQPGAFPNQPAAYPGPPAVYPGQQPGGYPGSPGYGPAQQGSGSTGSPRLEVSLLETQPYVQQPVLVQLDVLSAGNLATASPELAGFDAVLLEEVSGPTTSVRGSGRQRQIVNSYLLAMTPLRDGLLEVGPFKVAGTLAGGVPFSAVASAASRIDVRPVVASVRPWLPLQALQLTRELDETTPLAEGRPTTLSLRMQATGGTGAQLPDLEPMLRSNDFRAYREQTIIDTRLSDDGRALQGIRTEIYTLVPYSGGRLQLPELRVNWWNVETARRESSSVPIRSLNVAGESGPFGFGPSSGWFGQRIGSGPDSATDSRGDDEDWSWFWIPVGSVMLLLIGYWAGVWYRVKGSTARGTGAGSASDAASRKGRDGSVSRVGLRQGLPGSSVRLGSRLGAGLRRGLQRLDPRPAAAALGLAVYQQRQRLVPASTRVYRCAIEAERANSASEWALIFQTSACQSLRTPGREPLPRMADRILRLRPGADGERVRGLIQALDNALYNGAELDMQRWKRELRRALRPGWGGLQGLLQGRLQRARLPALNPGTSDG